MSATNEEQVLSEFIEKMCVVGLLEKRIGENGEVEYKKTEKLQAHCEEEPPITEDWFRTNAVCVCDKTPDNDYPCLCDEEGPDDEEPIDQANCYCEDDDINHPLYKDKTNYHEYTREECEYHNIDYDELHADDDIEETNDLDDAIKVLSKGMTQCDRTGEWKEEQEPKKKIKSLFLGKTIEIKGKHILTLPEDDIACADCDYTISQGEFDSGKGRIMFNDINEDGTEYRCGSCDDRVADPMGMFPDDEEDDNDIEVRARGDRSAWRHSE